MRDLGVLHLKAYPRAGGFGGPRIERLGKDGRLAVRTVRGVGEAEPRMAGLSCARHLEQSHRLGAFICAAPSRFTGGLAARPGGAATGRVPLRGGERRREASAAAGAQAPRGCPAPISLISCDVSVMLAETRESSPASGRMSFSAGLGVVW